MIDFLSLAQRLLSQSRTLLAQWFPAGKVRGHEFVVGDLAGAEGESLSINLNTGRWGDFSSGEKGGDLISLYAAMEGITQGEAAKRLSADTSITAHISTAVKPKEERRVEWTPIHPVPADAPPPPDEWYRKVGKDWVKSNVVKRWTYTNSTGQAIGHVCRFEWYDAKEELCKEVIPQVYCQNADGKHQWRWRSFSEPRPLYNLKELIERPDAPVMVVEGEKKVEALRILAPQYVGIAWAGGSKAWRKTAWEPLKSRKVLLWPDNDLKTVKTARESERYKVAIGELIPRDMQPGILAMWEIGHHVLGYAHEVKIILPVGKPDGWDAADAVADGMDWAAFKAWALPLVQQLTGANDGHGEASSAARRDRTAGVPAQDQSRQGTDAAATSGGVDTSAARPGEHAAAVGAVSGDDETHGGTEAGHGEPRSRASEPAAGDHRGTRGDAADRALSRSVPRDDRSAGVELRTASDTAPATAASGEAPQSQVGRWLSWGLDRNGNGLPYTNLNNAVRVLEADPNLKSLCWYDEFLQRVLTNDPPREWSDADDINLTLYMQREIGLTKIGLDQVRNAVVVIAHRDTRNCVRDWMNSLTWDETPRIDHFFVDVFGAEDNDYVRAAGRNFWLSIAARVFKPGCKVDNMIVLEGAQGLGKSQALGIIGAEWFGEQHESATNAKAFAEVLQGKLVIEISEMDAFDRAEVKRVKGVVSSASDRYRDAYGRHAKDHPRQGVMIGTTNKDDWNRDETGARRFWPIRCSGLVRLDVLAENRAMLFAEAVAAFKAGGSWWEMPAERTGQEQRARYDADPWIGQVGDYVSMLRETSTNEILIGCLHYSVREITRLEQMRVASCLRVLGWTNKGNVKRKGVVVKMWVNPAHGSDGSDVKAKGSDEEATENPDPFQ